MNFLQAAPEKNTYRRAFLAAGLFAIVLLPAIIWPHAFAVQTKRFFVPWLKAPLPYSIVAKPGDVAVARGQGVTLSAFLELTGNADSLPSAAALVKTDETGKTIRLGMKSEQAQIFFCKFNAVTESFRYHLEAGDAVGPEFTVTAVDPVQLVADSPAIAIAPPAYAQKAVETKTITGLGDFSALQYSRLTFAFRFDRPAQSATLEWIPASENDRPDAVKGIKHKLDLQEGGTTAHFEASALRHGRFVLTLEAEHGIRTELPPQSLNVLTDKPPAFVKVTGTSEQMRAVQAYETIPLEVALADDYGVESAVVEYRVNDGELHTEEMKLDGLGTPLASGKHGLKIAGKAREGQTFQFRLKIADNRNVPEAKLQPNVVYHPAENRWFSLKIAQNAEPLKQQEILAQRDDIRKRMQELIELLKKDGRMAMKARAERARRPSSRSKACN